MSAIAMLNGAGDRKAAAVLLLLVLSVIWPLPLLGPAVTPPSATTMGPRGHAGDFIAYYAAARLSAAGRREAPYLPEDFVGYTRSLGARADRIFAWAYPPFTLIWLAPLGRLPLAVALWTWVVAIAAAATLTTRLILGNWRFWWVGVLYPGTAISIICGQNGTFTGLLLAAGLVSIRSRPVLSGCALGLLTFKPQLALVPMAFVVSRKAWVTLAALTGTALAMILLSLVVDGTGVWFAFFEAVTQQAEYARTSMLPLHRMVTPFAAVATVTGSMAAAGVLQTGITCAIVAHILRGRVQPGTVQSTITLTLCVLLASPYAYDYDLAILGVPFLMLVDEWRCSGRLPERNLGWLWFLAAAPPLALFTGVLLGRSMMALIVVAAAACARFLPPTVLRRGPVGEVAP